jgi:hypothetical protein
MKKPDWRKSGDYSYTKKFKGAPVAWAWEFLRRNDGYRNDFNEWKSGKVTEKGYLPPKLRRETKKQWQIRCIQENVNPLILRPQARVARKWGLMHRMYDPELNAIELEAAGNEVEFDTDTRPMIVEKWDDIVENVPVEEEEGGVSVIRRDRLLVVFDLTGPITPQTNAVRKSAEKAKKIIQARNGENTKAEKPKSHIFLACLRVLDAIAEGEKNHAIASVLFPDDKADKDTKIHDCIDTAKRNRDTSYRAIARRRSKIKDV